MELRLNFCILSSLVLLWTVPSAEARYRDVFGDANVASVIRDVEEGRKLNDPAEATMGCVENELEYRGNDLKSRENVATAEACAQFCSEEPECFAWTWTKNIKTGVNIFWVKTYKLCVLKTANYGEDEVWNGDMISGVKDCVSLPCKDRWNWCHIYITCKNGKEVGCGYEYWIPTMCKKTCQICTEEGKKKMDYCNDPEAMRTLWRGR